MEITTIGLQVVEALIGAIHCPAVLVVKVEVAEVPLIIQTVQIVVMLVPAGLAV